MTEYSAPTQFIDLAQQQESIRPSIDKAIQKVLDHGQYIMGPEVKELESQLQNFTGASNVLSCANGTDALTLVLMAWDIGPGNAVFVPSFTYVATAEAPAQLGATPFFVDVIEDTFNIDPESFKQAIIECKKIGLKPSAVIPVDLFGQPADIDSIELIARSEGIKILIDGAQSFGGSTKNRKVGTMGDATTTSFFPAKPLGCYGDGGAIFTNNEEYASRINSIRLHGRGNQKYDNVRIGINSRLDTIQAAILIEKLKIFPNELDSRAKVANLYSELLSDVCSVPVLTEGSKSAWAQYTLKFEDRSKIQKKLQEKNIPSIVYYPIPLSNQLGYKHYPSVSTGVNNSSMLSKKVLSIPMHPYLKSENIKYITSSIIEILSKE
jgi:dTDP-4-amino-4,6-dideoxygalactose transaminase